MSRFSQYESPIAIAGSAARDVLKQPMLGFLAYSLLARRSQDRHAEDDVTMTINGDDVIARLERVENKVDALDKKVDVLDQRFDAVDKKLDAVDKKFDSLDQRFDAVDKKFDAVDKKFDALDKKVDAVDKKVDKRVDELANATKIQFEKVREDIKKLGEGYEQGLKQIARQIKSLGKEWSDKWTPHDMAIKDHGKRISALEQRQK